MPLVRYELRSEHSLANPELFRSAARDDPEGLLEGVAMAGLVGIVRQLGDLAEFAAEVFRDLHEEFVSVGGRAHDLTVRVRTLEAELPAVEKTLLSEPNQLRFAYTNGADWHASIRSDQNHCTSGDLPRFVRKYYQECRGPPRLFLLDKYDVVGAGACLKRYSDPSFFKLEWASSELMKAQRDQRDKKAQREKKKGRRRKTGLPTPAIHQIPARVRYGSATLEDLDTLSQLLAPTLKNEIDLSSSNQSGRDGRGTQTQRKSNLGPQNKESGYPPQPAAVSPAPQAESGASESLKLNAKEIEANSPRINREPGEKENVAAGKVAKVIDMEDHVATPAVKPVSRDMDKMSRRADELPLSGSNVVADRTKQVAGEDFEAAAVARAFGRKPEGDALYAGGEVPKLGNGSVSQSRLRNVFSKTSNADHSKEDVTPSESRTSSRTVAGDAGPQEDLSSTNTGDVRGPRQLFGKAVRKNFVDAKEAHVIAARFPRQGSGKLSRGTSDLGNAAGRDSAEHHLGNGSQRRSIAKYTSPADGGQDIDRQPEHYSSEASGHVPTPVGKSERSLTSSSAGGEPGFQDGREHITSNVVGTSEALRNMEERTNSPPRLPPIRIEEMRVQREEPPLISSQCSSPGPDDIRPSVSMLSRMSYSSELLGISSASEPDSPVSPNSPPFNALYSPPGSPSRFLGGMAESPPETYMGSYSPVADPSGYRHSRSEIPVLSLSPRSRSESPSWADQGDFGSAPVRPPPPPPTVISMAESRGQDESRQETRSVDSQPSHSTSPSLTPPTGSKADGDPSSLNEESGHVASSQDTAEEEPAGGSGDYLERVAHLETPRELSEGMRSPGANSEVEASFRSAASSPGTRGPLRSSMPSSFDNLDSDTTQPLSTGLVDLGPAESHNVDVLSEETTLRIGDSPPIPVGEDGAYTPFEPHAGSAADVSSNAVPVHHAPSSSVQAMNAAVYSMFAEGEDSEPSSPSGSVIIKDTPSPGSPTSDDSENEPEAHDYHASHGPVSPRSVAHALEDVINRGGTGSGHSSVQEDLVHEASQSVPTNAASTQEGGVVNSIAEHVVQAVCIAPEERAEAFVSQTSTELDIPQETNSSQDPTSALDRIDAITLRAIAVSTADVESHKRSASNSPPGTPPGKAFIAGEGEASTLQLEGRSRPESPYESGSRVAPASSSSTSATNSPPTSPPKMLEHASSLRWRGRPAEQDFSLPPNLVCHTETSSPPYSPPPASDLESPRPWDEVSEVSMSSDRSREEDGDVEVYPLPDSPAPPESPMMSEEGDSVSKRASDEDDDGAALEEVEVAESGPGRADHQLPLTKSSEALSSRPQVSDDVLPAREVPSTFQYSTPDLEVEHSQQSTLENEGNLDEEYGAHETPPPVSAPELADTQKELGVASTQQDWNVMKAMSVQDLNERQSPLESGPSEAVEEVEGKETMVRPASMINVAAILEKANAIRQAFVGSDDESNEDEWNDS